ncbi:MAG: molybdopterin-dependent oxidoreductase, partial [Actinobacteria bacterium]|nr:molybdopterin-dependent oxidoreductase [Actinomycetota bacterium]
MTRAPARTQPGQRPGTGQGRRPGADGVGASSLRPDGTLKVTGEFAFSSDLWMADMLWGATLRSPHPRAKIRSIDISGALRLPGVAAVLTHVDVPGRGVFGLEVPDQPVLARGEVRYQGEPVAIVAASHPETARRAAAAIAVDYEVLTPVTDAEAALRKGAARVHPGGNLVRHVRIRKGDPGASAEVVVRGCYQVGMQDQAFLGPESGLAVPAADGGVDLYVATQWLHVDQEQVAASLGLPAGKVRLTLAGVGGAFGAREDLSMQVHACLLALRTGRPVKMCYSREESFFGHVHRHPATLYYEHGATADGTLVYLRARIYLDGGAYASTSSAVAGNAGTLGAGPYRIPNVSMDVYAAYTNNPPCGAMRGFGAVQACFGYESQLDELARRLGADPAEVRIRNALCQGSTMPTGQLVDSPAPVAELLRRVRAAPLPPARPGGPAASPDLRELPGGVANTTHGEGVTRGIGYGVGIKNVGFSEGFDDYSTARVRLELAAGEPVATVHTAAAEVGQGLVTVQAQIARTELGVERVVVHPADTSVGSAGSSSASRQTYVTGGAVRAACAAVRAAVLARAAGRCGGDPGELELSGGKVVSATEGVIAGLATVLGGEAIERTVTWR